MLAAGADLAYVSAQKGDANFPLREHGNDQSDLRVEAVPNATWYQLWVDDSSASAKIKAWFTATRAGCASGKTEVLSIFTTQKVPGTKLKDSLIGAGIGFVAVFLVWLR